MAIFQCQQAEITTDDYPIVVMEDAETSPEGVIFKANIKNRSNQPIESFGFFWDEFENPIAEDSNIIESFDVPSGDELVLEVNSGLLNNRIYYVRPFVKTANRLIYGTEFRFVSIGSKNPRLIDFQPKISSFNQVIEITGEDFSPSASGNIVKVGTINASVDSASTTSIFFRVPKVMKDTMLQISIETTLKSASFNESLKITFPWEAINQIDEIERNSTLFTIGNNAYIVPSRSESRRSTSGLGIIYNQPGNTLGNFTIPVNTYGLRPLSFTIGNKGYVLFEESFYEYDPASDIWTRKADFPDTENDRVYAFAFGFEQFGAIGFYRNSGKVWAYNPFSDEWISRAGFPAVVRNNLISVRNHFEFSIANEGYFGFSENIIENKFWKYDFTNNQWVELAAYEDLFIAAPMIINNEKFVGISQSTLLPENSWVRYDAASNQWEIFQNHENIRNPDYSFSINNKGYVLNRNVEDFTIWEFIPEEN